MGKQKNAATNDVDTHTDSFFFFADKFFSFLGGGNCVSLDGDTGAYIHRDSGRLRLEKGDPPPAAVVVFWRLGVVKMEKNGISLRSCRLGYALVWAWSVLRAQ